MWKEAFLTLPLITNYARAVYAAANPPTYQLGPAARGDFAGDVGQASVGSAGTVSSEGLTRVAQMPWAPVTPTPATAAACDSTPIFLTVTGVGTLTTPAGCTTADIIAIGGGEDGGGGGTTFRGGYGGGMGADNGVSVAAGGGNKYQVGAANAFNIGASTADTFWCPTTANCGSLGASAVVAGATGGYGAGVNIGATVTRNGGAGGAGKYGLFGGGGGGGAGYDGAGIAGSSYPATTGGGGNNLLNGGGTGGGYHAAGGNGTDLGSSKGAGGGGGASNSTTPGGAGGKYGAGGGGGPLTGGVGKQGIIRVIFH